jgi:hypothetical protein
MIGTVKIGQIVHLGKLEGMSRGVQEAALPYSDQAVEQAILLALKGIRYGSVEIIVHDSKVVQIERKEKTRFDGTLSRPVR